MAKKPLPTPEELRQLLRYEPETGKLYWLARGPEWFADGYRTAQGEANNFNSRYAGKEAGCLGPVGYYYVGLPGGRHVPAHRVIWALVNGNWPDVVDHIDGDPLNNRIGNLRDISQAGNLRNARMWSHNTSGVTGVYWIKRTGKWRAAIKVDGKTINLGERRDFDEAVQLRRIAEAAHGFTARHGR